MNNLGEKKIGETKPKSDVPSFNIELKEVKKKEVKSEHEIELDKYQEQRRLEREAYIKKEREKKIRLNSKLSHLLEKILIEE